MFPNRWITAGATAAWMAFFLLPEPRLAWLAVPACVLAMLVMPERPIVATAIVLASSGLMAIDGRPFGDVELLLPTFASLNWLGRSGRPIPIGIVAVAGFTLTSMLRPSLWLSALLSAGTVYGIAWGFGVLVHRRAVAAAAAVRVAEQAAAVDIEELATASAAGERRRLAKSTVGDLQASLASIARLARSAREWPELEWLSAIRRAADEALVALHADLATLTGDRARRSSVAAAPTGSAAPTHEDAPPTAPSPAGATAARRARALHRAAPLARRVAVGAAFALGGSVAMLVGTELLGGDWTRFAYALLAALLPLAAVAARRTPLVAAGLAATAFIGAALDMPHAPEALVPTGVALLTLCWRLASAIDPRRPWRDGWRTYLALGVTVASGVVLGVQHGRSSAGFIVLAALLTLFGAHAWAERDHVTQAEEARAARLLAHAATARLEAERNERRGMARELHDVVSHAIVGISLQAQAAAGASRAGRRAALDAIADVAAASSRELGGFAEQLRPDTSARSIAELARTGRSLGLEMRIDEGRIAPDPLAVRIVRECLTNAARYAAGATVDVRVAASDGMLEVSVRNGPASSTALIPLRPGRGSGLAGLRDEVTGRGGTFEAGPDASGFLVVARYPALDTPAPPPAEPPPPPRFPASPGPIPASPASPASPEEDA
ncbi:hypothetical protein GCM10011490_22090 [Pseudoclavibacter endophyticus]|nr:hypothetical protein GCM10011490_22090 [Pseudoclavibacter endophyticus]